VKAIFRYLSRSMHQVTHKNQEKKKSGQKKYQLKELRMFIAIIFILQIILY